MFPIRDHNPSGRTPFVTYALIAINVGVFLYTLDSAMNDRALDALYAQYALVPRFLTEGFGYGGLVTSMFLHGGLLHLAGNMLYLYIFGDNLEDAMGHLRFGLFYLAAGVLAGLVHYASAPLSMVPTVGASGAVAGVMGGYLLLFPRARVDILVILIVFFKVIPVPAWLTLALWLGLQVWGGIGASPDEGGIAYWAHIGGFVAGMALALPTFRRLGGVRFWSRSHGLPPHPAAPYRSLTAIPKIRRR
ncbi:rhomboid family intramembrane serine protease [Sagittula salina]|uniref:Rhomboid family intramembrane serine protease n=1 Tax=Sagittula salina TaxID=2820268 RepID=A0A940MRY7_9RHOB|nr:rhomboid family intramembrane serine protease [Sagittula salina]MBP0483593.1 rhomboid family intramembrane serine protease [Sagittula salina]